MRSADVATPETPPFDTSTPTDELCNNEQLQELVALGSKIPSRVDSSRGMNIQEIAEGVRKACKVDEPAQAKKPHIATLIEKFRKQLGQT